MPQDNRVRKAALIAAAAVSLAANGAIVVRNQQARRAPRQVWYGARFVRPAGPDVMRSPPKDWDIVDEQADQSFPASDPPGNY